MITQETARQIWNYYQEIENAQKLLEEMDVELAKGNLPNPRDAVGRRGNFELGVPSGNSGHRLFSVNPEMARAVIETHISEKQAQLKIVNEKAKAEA